MSPAAPKFDASYDPTIYPVTDDMGENSFETFVRLHLVPLLERYLTERGTPFFVGANQFIYWEQYNPKRCCIAPDVYVVPGLPQGAEFGCIKTWENGLIPTFALEIVSEDKGKDYYRSPIRYGDLGVKELVIFDPKFHERRDGCRFQVYRRVPKRGWIRVEATNEDRVRSKVLGCWLRIAKVRGYQRLRLGIDPYGDELFSTEVETERAAKEQAQSAEAAERAAKEQAQSAEAAERAAKEAERAAREQAEQELKRLQEELQKLRNQN